MAKLREQHRATEALREVKATMNAKDMDRERLVEYRQELQQTPSRILTSGLGQTLAFYASKKGNKGIKSIHEIIGDQISRFLSGEQRADTLVFLDRIMKMETKNYRYVTRHALAYAEWLKRYSKALIAD